MRQIALDIEATHRTPKPDFDSPSTWRIIAVALSLRRTPTATPETTVIVRRDGTDHGRRKLLCSVANWVGDRAPIDCLLSYNGLHYDLAVLGHHIGEIAKTKPALAKHIRRALDITHRDLLDELKAMQDPDERWPSLDRALAVRGIDAPTVRLNGDIVNGALMPAIGNRLLDPDVELGEHERAALKKYAKSDVEPLHALADQLTGERTERIEAEARAAVGQSATNTESDR